MAYHSLRQCVDDLEKEGELVRIEVPIDANLEAAAIQRRVFAAGGPALLFTNVVGCQFPMVSNLFGTRKRARFLFRDTYAKVQRLIDLKIDPMQALRHPLKYAGTPRTAFAMLPKLVRNGPVMAHQTTLSQLPQMVSWPNDGGAYVTLPQVYTEDVRQPGLTKSNLGMYRIQLSGGNYAADEEVGLHYQIHRSIGVHQQAALELGKPFRVNVFVGGSPAMNLSAVMPLPEGMSELTFAGALSGRRIRMVRRSEGLPVHADTDFAICGTVVPGRLEPEGPFGDHLGYYSLAHPFPVLKVEQVYHRKDAIWPFTVVGRPPQEDTMFGWLIHDLTGPIIPSVLPGVKQIHAVDEAGVHPLLLAIGSERYTPYQPVDRPQELLTQASAILGQGQLSLAKFLWIASQQDDPQLDANDIGAFLTHMLARADWNRDLHFHTETTIDTLDYSGGGLNAGSKVVVAAVGPPRFDLLTELPSNLQLPPGYTDAQIVMPGVLAVRGPKANGSPTSTGPEGSLRAFCESFATDAPINRFRLILVVDDPLFVSQGSSSQRLANFLWVIFTRTNPAADTDGIGASVRQKHWGCSGSLVLDARAKPHHAPELAEAAEVTRRVEALAVKGGPLAGLL